MHNRQSLAILVVTILLLACGTASFAQAQLGRDVVLTEHAENCPLVAEHFLVGNGPVQIWLHSDATPQTDQMLATYVRNATLLFSPDCSAILLNDHFASTDSSVRLFLRTPDHRYQDSLSDITAAGWSALARATGLSKPPQLGHRYVEAIAWSSDSQAVLLRLNGHSDSANHVDDWYCVYDVGTGRVTTDLSAMNRAAVTIDGHLP